MLRRKKHPRGGHSLLPLCYMDRAGRDRCSSDSKVVYLSEREAQDSVELSRALSGLALRTYQGFCGYWHLSSQRQTRE